MTALAQPKSSIVSGRDVTLIRFVATHPTGKTLVIEVPLSADAKEQAREEATHVWGLSTNAVLVRYISNVTYAKGVRE